MPRFGTKLDAATPGLSKLAAALGGGQQSYQQGFDESALLQSRLAQALSQIRHNDAGAAQTNAETSVLQSRPAAIDEAAAMQSGSTLPMVQAVQQFVRTGVRPMRDLQGPADEAGNGPGQAPVVDDGQQSKISLALQRLLPMRTNLKDTKVDDAAKAAGLYREQDLSDKVIAGQLPRNVVGGAQAAVGAKPLFHAGENGAVLDQYGGALDTANPMAGATINLRTQQGAQAKAGAAENYAQAGAANARANALKMAGVGGGAGGKIPVGYRWTQDEAGEPKLEPIPGGPKDPNAQTGKPLPASAAKGYLENQTNLQRAEKALALVEGMTVGEAQGDKQATGMKGFLPNGLLNRIDPKGAETRAAISDLGSLVLHDRSGAAVTAAEFPRLAPFIPTHTDDQATSEKKLRNFVQNYRAIVEDAEEFYKASGYNVPKITPRNRPTPAQPGAAPAGNQRTPSGAPRTAAPPAAAPPAGGGGFVYLGKEG